MVEGWVRDLARVYAASMADDIHIPTCARIIQENNLRDIESVHRFFKENGLKSVLNRRDEAAE